MIRGEKHNCFSPPIVLRLGEPRSPTESEVTLAGREFSVTAIDERPATALNNYNSLVNPRAPKPATDGKRPNNARQRHHATYAAEASGLLLMAVLLLILIIIRYWHYIPWSAR